MSEPILNPNLLNDLRASLAPDLATAELVEWTPPRDPAWLSALRGRLLAALASGISLWFSGGQLLALIGGIQDGGLTAAAGAELVTHAGVVYDAAGALVIAGASLVALVASVGSKAREWARGLTAPRAVPLDPAPPDDHADD